MREGAGTRTLDPAVAALHTRIRSLLPAETNDKIRRAVPAFREQTRTPKPGTDLRALATAQVRKQFPNLTPRQTEALAFALLNATCAILPPAGDLSTEQQVPSQQSMEQKSQFETALSSMMKSVSETSDSIIQNIQ